jgi:D-hexose-6-phosphate mutarotase
MKFGMLLVLTLFMFQNKGELECVWCSMLKNFKGPLKIKGRV